MGSSKIRRALSHGHPVREVRPAKRAQQEGGEVNAKVLPQKSLTTLRSEGRRVGGMQGGCEISASRLTARCHAKLGFARVWVRWLARAHAGRKAGVAGTHLEGRVETVRDRAVRESLAEAQAQ